MTDGQTDHVKSCSSLDSFTESLAQSSRGHAPSVEQPDLIGVILRRKFANYQDKTILLLGVILVIAIFKKNSFQNWCDTGSIVYIIYFVFTEPIPVTLLWLCDNATLVPVL